MDNPELSPLQVYSKFSRRSLALIRVPTLSRQIVRLRLIPNLLQSNTGFYHGFDRRDNGGTN